MANQPNKSATIFLYVIMATACSVIGSQASADGFDLSTIKSSRALDAILYADNGKAVGMKITLSKNSLTYKAVKGKFALDAAGRFDLSKMAPSYNSVYKNADGAFIYAVKNWKEIEINNQNNIHFSGEQAPKYIYTYTAKYVPTGQSGIFVCTILNDDLDSFFTTASGHGRCDVFRAK